MFWLLVLALAPVAAGGRVCLATHGLVGPVRNGGIATASTELALLLAAAHHNVTVLYLAGDVTEGAPMREWVAWYAQQGVAVVLAPPMGIPPLQGSLGRRISYQGMVWLQAREAEFDVVYFHDWRGSGYYSLMLKRMGQAFRNVFMVVGLHAPTLWSLLHSHQTISSLDQLEENFLERESVQLADLVVSPSRYMVKWVLEQGWLLKPSATRIVHNPMHRHWTPAAIQPRAFQPSAQGVHLVFFGRLEERKGLVLFCDALTLSLPVSVRVTFLGKSVHNAVGTMSSLTYLKRATATWVVQPTILDDLDTSEALVFLASASIDTLVVIPSLVGFLWLHCSTDVLKPDGHFVMLLSFIFCLFRH